MNKIRVWVLVAAVAICGATAVGQEKEKEKPSLAPTSAEMEQIAALDQAYEQSVQEEIAIRSRAVNLRPSDQAGYEAVGRSLAQVVLTQQALQQRSQDWLKAVQQRTGCTGCGYNRQAKTLVPPEKPAEKK